MNLLFVLGMIVGVLLAILLVAPLRRLRDFLKRMTFRHKVLTPYQPHKKDDS